VHSFIPGMVVRVVAQAGERLSAGAPILTFRGDESGNTLTMPYDGVVREDLRQSGEVFAKDVIWPNRLALGGKIEIRNPKSQTNLK